MRKKNCFSALQGFLLLVCLGGNHFLYAQVPVIKVDLNITGRQAKEVNEIGFIPWAIKDGKEADTTFGKIRIRFTAPAKQGGAAITTGWYKVGVQTPYYARLVNDGITGKDGGDIEMHIQGLPPGRNTLLTYHNSWHDPATASAGPIDIFVNGARTIQGLIPGSRALNNADAQVAYLPLEAVAGKEVVIRFASASAAGANNAGGVIINGFELNTSDPRLQARLPRPLHGDEHADADNGSLTLSWTNPEGSVSQDIYFGTSEAELNAADRRSAAFKKTITGNSYTVNSQYSMDTYYWRIDEKDKDGKITKGKVWYYRPRQLAFPGAEGYGRYARGGRGGKVVEVTNLNDDGPGSLREAVMKDIGPRTIVFAVSGIIELKSRLTLSQPYVTVAGQTAPGKGICIRRSPFGFTGNDVVVRHTRLRLGGGTTADGMGLTGCDNSIMDHCSISWTIDESFSSRGAKNITLQRTLISEALNVAGHRNYRTGTAHGYAATIGGDKGSFHHNLLAHCYGRNWSMGGGLDGNGYYSGRLDIRNNVVYNWGTRATDGGAKEVNFVGNYYKPGAGTAFFYAFNAQHEGVGKGTQRCYFNGNVMPGHFDESNQADGRKASYSNGDTSSYETFVSAPFFESYVTTQTAREAYKDVLSDVGCSQPVLDEHDIRMIRETMDSTYSVTGSVSGKKGFPDKEQDAGGYEDYPVLQRDKNWDTDHDGLPDWWEKLQGTSVSSRAGDFSDANADPDRDGYTRLDDYLEWMANPHYFAKGRQPVDIDLPALTRGYTAKPVYKVVHVTNGTAAVIPGNKLRFTPSGRGLAQVSFSVKDAEGNTLTRTVGIMTAL